jgi:hypothetical protein
LRKMSSFEAGNVASMGMPVWSVNPCTISASLHPPQHRNRSG